MIQYFVDKIVNNFTLTIVLIMHLLYRFFFIDIIFYDLLMLLELYYFVDNIITRVAWELC